MGGGNSHLVFVDESDEKRTSPILENFKGSLLGQCVGDFLGFLVEGESPAQCKSFVDNEILAYPGKISEKLIKRAQGKGITVGQYSDDSQMTREMIQSIVEIGTFSAEKYATFLARLVKESRIMGCGLATAKAVAKLNQGKTWEEAGSPAGSAGNGTAIRAAPIGLLFYDDEEQLVKAAKDQAWITHQDPRCLAGSVAIAAAVSLCLRYEKISLKTFVEELHRVVLPVHAEFAKHITSLKQFVELPPEKAALLIKKLGQDYDDGSTGISGFVISSVIWALYCFLMSKRDFVKCITIAIQAGGDTDSTAAMAGCLSGCFLGLEKLKEQCPLLLESINDRNTFNFQILVDLTEKLFTLKNS